MKRGARQGGVCRVRGACEISGLGLETTCSSSRTIEVYDLPAGDYRIQTTLPYGWIWNFYTVPYGMIVDYDNYYTVQVQTEICRHFSRSRPA